MGFKVLSKYALFGILMDSSVLRIASKSHHKRTSEKQACVARRQPSELLESVFVQIILSLLASVKSIFSVNKHFGSKP